MKPILLILLQVLCILFILFTGPLFPSVVVLMLVQALGILMIIWSLLAIWQNRKTVYKLPRGFFFATTGPYEIIRHPISASFFFILFALVQTEMTPVRGFVLVAFIALTIVKASLDEVVMRQNVKAYAQYELKTKKIIPYVY